ncbi:MAG TPA: hypothetical protein VGB47_02985 [Thermoanaerobaculia bacterium]|jgi:hypothetical protein
MAARKAIAAIGQMRLRRRARVGAGAASAAVGARVSQLRQPEVEDLDQTLLGHHHVLGLQVPVHDAGFVGAGETVGHLRGDR